MEWTVNKKLIWFIESNNLITNSQCRFRNQIPTMDHIVRLETSIREANIQKQHLITVVFYLEKATKITWKYGIMKNQHNLQLKGRLSNFIKNFLQDKLCQISIIKKSILLWGTPPHRSILFVILFNLKRQPHQVPGSWNWWLTCMLMILYHLQP